MARVKLKTFSVIRDVLGGDAIEVTVPPPETVEALFDTLVRRYGAPFQHLIWDQTTGKMEPFLLVHNGTLIRSTVDMQRHLTDGDELSIIFPVGGG